MGVLDAKTFSVPELRKMLGLKKTESYWLVHKNYFETIVLSGRMRVVTESFMHWYDRQDHYSIIGGPKPGKEIRKEYYTSEELSEVLGIKPKNASFMARYHEKDLDVIIDNHKMRIRKDSFDKWVKTQNHYRTKKYRKSDDKLRALSISIPEMGRILGVTRDEAYDLVHDPKRNDRLQVMVVAGQKRILLDSFREWYMHQDEYHFEDDKDFFGMEMFSETGEKLFSVRDASGITGIPTDRLYRMIYSGELPATVIDGEKKVRLADISTEGKEAGNGVHRRKK